MGAAVGVHRDSVERPGAVEGLEGGNIRGTRLKLRFKLRVEDEDEDEANAREVVVGLGKHATAM